MNEKELNALLGNLTEANDKENKIKKKGIGKNSLSNSSGKKSSGLMTMANNPMVQMLIKQIPKKYIAIILIAFGLIVVGAGTTIYGIYELVTYITNLF